MDAGTHSGMVKQYLEEAGAQNISGQRFDKLDSM